MGQFTEAGPLARAGWTTDEIIDELESSAATRYAALSADPPTDAKETGPGFAQLLGWSWETLLTNRPLDIWMHEQDIRRATGRTGNLDSPAAAHVGAVFTKSLPFVLGKRVGAAPGTTVVLEVTGTPPRVLAATVGDDGRGAPLAEPPAQPTARVSLDFESWIVLAGGRRPAADVEVEIARRPRPRSSGRREPRLSPHDLERRRRPRPHRASRPGHRRHQRAGRGDRPGARPRRSGGRPGRPQPRQARGHGRPPGAGRARRPPRPADARPGRSGLGTTCRDRGVQPRRPRHPRQQRRGDGDTARADASTGSSCRWAPTTSATSRSPGCSSTHWSPPGTPGW